MYNHGKYSRILLYNFKAPRVLNEGDERRKDYLWHVVNKNTCSLEHTHILS